MIEPPSKAEDLTWWRAQQGKGSAIEMTEPDSTVRSPEDVVARALDHDPEDDDYWANVQELHRRGTRPIFDLAAQLTSSPAARSRQLGLDILAQLGYEQDRPFLEAVIPIATKLAGDSDSSVRTAALAALGNQRDARVLPTLLAHKSDPDADARLAVAQSIPSVVSNPPEADAIATLLALTRDADSDVRDWATFGIGSVLDVDSPQIRDALADRLEDAGGDAAGEALVGLARRRDPRVVERLHTLLDDPNVGNLIVEAAAELADPALLPPLLRLREAGWADGDPRSHLLNEAIEASQSGHPADC